jgi:hypothetical protein
MFAQATLLGRAFLVMTCTLPDMGSCHAEHKSQLCWQRCGMHWRVKLADVA